MAFEETAKRLGGVEAQLEQLKRAVRQTQQMGASLPLEHLDAAASQLQAREMQALKEGLEEQRRGMHELRSTKAYHHDLEAAREQFARFLFHHPQRGGLPQPPPPRDMPPLVRDVPPLGAVTLARGAAFDLDSQLDATGTHRRGFDQPPAAALTPRLSALTPLPIMGASLHPDPPSSIEPTSVEAPPQPPPGPRPAALAAWSSPRSSPRARPSTVVGGQSGGKASRAPPAPLFGAALPQFSSSAR